jgi:hypothetical protein
MDERERQFLDLYRRHRFEGQLAWYKDRTEEFVQAGSQVVTGTAVLLFLAFAAGALGSFDVFGWRVGWAVVAAFFSACATSLAAYDALLAFDRTAKLYRDAADALERLRSVVPGADLGTSVETVAEFVERAEGVFSREGGQWGQLAGSWSPPADRDG